MGHMMDRGVFHSVQWCGTRDMTADGHTRRCTDRASMLQAMEGNQSFKCEVKRHIAHRDKEDT
eukprot:5060934-Pyramimonas_sp.AAC.1